MIDKFFVHLTPEQIRERLIQAVELYLEKDEKYIVKLFGHSITFDQLDSFQIRYQYVKSFTESPSELLNVDADLRYQDEGLASYEARYDETGRLLYDYITPYYIKATVDGVEA